MAQISQHPNCPFYGRAMFWTGHMERNQPPFLLYDSRGNQCGMITTSHSPCQMEVGGETPDWMTCVLVRWSRGEEVV